MAAVQKSKAKQRAAASAVLGLEEEEDVARKAAIAKCVSKVGHLKRVIFKSAFSKVPHQPRRVVERQLELAKRLDGHDPLAALQVAGEGPGDEEELDHAASARPSAISDDTIMLSEWSTAEDKTYKDLLDHVRKIERDYEDLALSPTRGPGGESAGSPGISAAGSPGRRSTDS
jgi:hypothetical protein